MRLFSLAASLVLAILAAGSVPAHAQITVTQQPGALAAFKQPVAPIVWIAVGQDSQIHLGSGAEWKEWLLNGKYTVLAVGADGKVLSQSVVISGGTPNPPNPPDPPNPPPGKISAALVLNPDKLQTQSPQQAAAWIDGGAAAYMAKAGYRWRQIVSDSLDESGQSPASELFFLQAAAKSGKSYPVLVIGTTGSADVQYAETCPDIDTRNKALQRYGGPGEFPQLPAVDWSKTAVDIGDPANEVRDGKPKYEHFANHGVRWGLRPAPPRELRHHFLLQAANAFPDIPESAWATWAASHQTKGLNARKPAALDQNGYGACAAFAATNGVLFCEAVSGQPPVELSALSVYARSSPWPADNGSDLETNAKIIEQEGIPEVNFAPQYFGQDKYTNPKTWPAGWKENAAKHRCQVIDLSGDTAEQSFHNLVVALLRGFPAAIGVDWPGGHSIIAVGVVFTSGKVTGILIQNSWGADWNGDGTTVRSRANVTNGCATFGGPFAYVSPTFRSQAAKLAKPAEPPAKSAEQDHKMAL